MKADEELEGEMIVFKTPTILPQKPIETTTELPVSSTKKLEDLEPNEPEQSNSHFISQMNFFFPHSRECFRKRKRKEDITIHLFGQMKIFPNQKSKRLSMRKILNNNSKKTSKLPQ
jgi:hypothetical protein